VSAPVYAVTRKRNPTTGEVLIDGNRWVTATSPMIEVVLMALRTSRGLCAADPTFGVDWKRVRKFVTGTPATARAVIEEGLRYLVTAGQVADLTVEVEADVRAGLLLYVVSFTDPRLDVRGRIRGSI
jgi:hypothetical protein